MARLGWARWSVCVGSLGLAACGPSTTVVDGAESGDGDTTEATSEGSTSTTADTSTTGDAPPPVELPTRLLFVRTTLEGGAALEMIELGDDGDHAPRPLHPELDATTIVVDYEVLAGTDRVAFTARAGAEDPARLYVARAEPGASGTSTAIDLDGDVVDLAWVESAATLVVATSVTTYRIAFDADGHGEPVEMDGPSGPAQVLALDEDGMRVAADFSAPGEPSACFVASIDPDAPSGWIEVFDGAAGECSIEGFDAGGVVVSVGNSLPLSLWRAAFVAGVPQPAVQVAADADYQIVVARSGIVYRTDGDVSTLVYVPTDGDTIGEARTLSDGPTNVLFTESRDGRTLLFGAQGVAQLVDLEAPDVRALAVPLPSPYTGWGGPHALSADGAYVFIVGAQNPSENYWEATASLWRVEITGDTAHDPVLVAETMPTFDGTNPSSLETLAITPDGATVVYSRTQPGFTDGGDVALAHLGPDGVTETFVLQDGRPTSMMAFSPDGDHVAFGDVAITTRNGEPIAGSPAQSWTWWAPRD